MPGKTAKRIAFLLFLLLLLRLIMLGIYPLMDTTEARYAEIGRKMVELNDMVTPWFDYQVPFWGKPPLSFWVTAISFKLFGVSEFSARLPHYLCGLLILGIMWRWLDAKSTPLAFSTVTILATSALFYGSAGVVMTDMWLVLGTTLAMIGFWSAIQTAHSKSRYITWLFFVGLGIGLLAKGPVTLVLVGVPVGLWTIARRAYSDVWKRIPWVRGALLTGLIALPWYVLAEFKTPGFLDYFIIGEHFNRYVLPGWQGDLYGSAHDEPRGMIWLFLLVDALPWSLIVILFGLFLWKKRKLTRLDFDDHGWRLYLLLWALAPALFFTFAGNILAAYLLPAMPALAVLIGQWLEDQSSLNESTRHSVLQTGVLVSLVFSVAVFSVFLFGDTPQRRSAKDLVDYYNSMDEDATPLVYFNKRPFSASFYSKGEALEIHSAKQLSEFAQTSSFYLVLRRKDKEKLSEDLRRRLSNGKLIGKYWLYKLDTPIAKTPLDRARRLSNEFGGKRCGEEKIPQSSAIVEMDQVSEAAVPEQRFFTLMM